ncbi:MAG: cache domain-containing protein [Campylobacterales bacterium]|nr:cache domain-containing protein [Campylobacterales bacterium]
MAEISNDKIMSVIPSISEYQRELDSLNNQLGKTTLTGKISSLEIAETLFIYMEETQERFTNLQKDLIDSLVDESIIRVSSDMTERLDLVSNLFETIMKDRGRDALVLAKDLDVKAFLQNANDKELFDTVDTELNEFLKQYPFYRDVFIVTNDEKVVLSKRSKIKQETSCPFLKTALSIPDGEFVSHFGDSTLEPKISDSIYYTATVYDDNGATLGGVIISFDMVSEMETIAPYFNNSSAITLVVSNTGTILSSSSPGSLSVGTYIKRTTEVEIIKYKGIEYLAISKEIDLGEEESEIFSVVLVPINTAFKKSKDFIELDEETLEKSHIVSEKLKATREQSEEINEDLIDVVINGEIIASKKRAYALNPILENIRIISERINVSFSTSIADIHDTVIRSKLDDVREKSSTVMRVLSRVLFLQISDCTQISSIDEIVKVVSMKERGEEDIKLLTSTLERYGNMNESYFNIYAFDTTGTILGVSNTGESSLIGRGVENDTVKKALSLGNSGTYSMTDLAHSSFYSDQETFVVSTPITSKDGKVVGGIAVILDYEQVIRSLLKIATGHKELIEEENKNDKKGYIAVVNKDGLIVSIEGDSEQKKGETLDVPPSYFINASKEGFSDLEKVGEDYYTIGATLLSDYRTFSFDDNRKSDLISVVVSKI